RSDRVPQSCRLDCRQAPQRTNRRRFAPLRTLVDQIQRRPHPDHRLEQPMSQPFDGFLPGKQPTFVVPSALIAELLPLIDDLAELKVTLYFIWAIQQREGRYRYLRREDFLRDTDFMAGLAGMDFDPRVALDNALDRA